MTLPIPSQDNLLAIPCISDYMTPSPHTIGEDIGLNEAIHRMREFQIRHLPVLRAGKLVGILSDRDVKLALSVHPEATNLKVGDIMTEDAYTVTVDTPLDEATEVMCRHRYGCTIVVDRNRKIVGVFTEVDALKVLTSLLRSLPMATKPLSVQEHKPL